MTDKRCGYGGDREDLLIAYLYDEIDPAERRLFEAHLPSCSACRGELDELRGVRAQLSGWAPPALRTASIRQPNDAARVLDDPGRPSAPPSRVWWNDVPAWARVAAAVLVLAASAGLANLNVRYDRDGLTVRTGWSRLPDIAPPAPVPSAVAAAASAPWRPDLAALELQLRSEMRAVSAHPAPARAASSDAEILRQVRALIADSERRQQSELALRVAGVVRDVNAVRTADLARIERTLGVLQNTTGAELIKQRQQMMNYLTQVSLKR